MKSKIYTTVSTMLFAMGLVLASCTPSSTPTPTPEPENPWDNTTVEVYKYSSQIVPSIIYGVSVNGQNCLVYPCSEPHVATFGADGLVEVKVDTYTTNIESVVVRPQAKEYEYRLENGSVYLYLRPYDQVSVEVNGDLENPLFIFVNPLEKDKPNPEDENVVYYKAGEVYNVPSVVVKSGQTVYIEGGAVIYGGIFSESATDITITGCGIVDSRETGSTWGTRISYGKNVKLENILQFNHAGWSCAMVQCDNCHLFNYKIIAPHNPHNQYGIENGGISMNSCWDSSVKNCWAFGHDDAYMIKSRKWGWDREVKNVTFENCIGWNVEAGNTFEVGYEMQRDVDNVKFKDIYAIHSGTRNIMRRAAISIHQAAAGKVTNISYENVHIEDPQEYGIYLSVMKSGYDIGLKEGEVWTPGSIDGVTFKNVYIYKDAPQGNLILYGYDSGEHNVRNLTFENLFINGEKITSWEQSGAKIDTKHALGSGFKPVATPAKNVTFK